MNIQQIRELAQVMRENGLTSLRLTEGALSIELERGGHAAAQTAQTVPTVAELPSPEPEQPTAQPSAAPVGKAVTAPMVGVFYEAPSPEAQPYVQVGSQVKKGDVLCIIEAMKLMNEITAEQDGKIAEVCVQSGSVVEYGQPLFRIVSA